MYVCLCNAVTESEVSEACDRGAKTLPDLKEQLGVATGCGQCAQTCCAMLEGRDALEAMPATPETSASEGVVSRYR